MTDKTPMPTEAQGDEATQFAMETLKRIPQGNPQAIEAHLTSVLIIFWAALWGTMGTEYARDFIEAQLRGMEPDVPHDRFIPPTAQ